MKPIDIHTHHMIVMVANNSKWQVHYWQGRYGGLAHLYSPGAQPKSAFAHLPYALDNGAWIAHKNRAEWQEKPWLDLLRWARSQRKPAWVLCPDYVGDRQKTLELWEHYSPVIRDELPYCRVAFAMQDGMRKEEVPCDADVLFLGGSTEWKWRTLPYWAETGKPLHVGRVNTYKRLMECAEHGVDSVDGTGWFRGDKAQLRGLEAFLANQPKLTEALEKSVITGVTNRRPPIRAFNRELPI